MNKILSLWATPRSTSTAFEWMMRERGDFQVFHEPFGQAYYFSEERQSDRAADVEPQPQHNYQAILQNLLDKAQDQPVFIKDFPYHIIHLADQDFLSHFQHTFLIRQPSKSLPSFFDRVPDFTLDETSYQAQWELFDKLETLYGQSPLVIDADDLLEKPAAMIQMYCDSVGLPFIPEAMNWEIDPQTQVTWWWSGVEFHDTLKSSHGFQKSSKPTYAAIADHSHLKQAYEFCLPYYQRLYSKRRQVS